MTGRFGKIAFYVLCFTTALRFARTADKLAILREAIAENNIASKPLTDRLTVVTVNNRNYTVYVYKAKENNTLNDLIVCMNCEFGKWTVNELLKFLKPFPLKNHSSFVGIQNNAFGLDYRRSVKALNRIAEYAGRFVNILLNYVNASAHDSSVDADLLKSLLSLGFKIDYIKTLGCRNRDGSDGEDDGDGNNSDEENENSADDESDVDDGDSRDDDFDGCGEDGSKGHDDVVVRLIFETVNSIRGFMALNCEFPHPVYGLNVFERRRAVPAARTAAGESDVDRLVNVLGGYGIDEFLGDVSALNLDGPDRCSAEQTLLSGAGAWLWAGVEWRTEDESVPMGEVVERMAGCHDLEIVLWYLDMVFKTIVKVVLVKVSAASADAFPGDAVDRLGGFYAESMADLDGLPADAIEIFRSFYDYHPDDRDGLVRKIDGYTSSAASEVRFRSDARGPLLSRDLDGLLDLMSVRGVRCLLRLFGFLRREDARESNSPFAADPAKIHSFARDFRPAAGAGDRPTTAAVRRKERAKNEYLNAAGCRFVRGLYHFCFAAFVALNSASSGFSSADDAGGYYDEAIEYLEKIVDRLTSLVSNGHRHRAHFRMVYRTAPLMEWHAARMKQTADRGSCHDLARLVYAAVAEFGSYWLQHCRPPEFDLWFLSNLNLGRPGRLEPADRETSEALEAARRNGGGPNFPYVGLVDFDGLANIFDSYERKVLFRWKSQTKSIGHVYESTRSAVLGPSAVYRFYDFYQRFFLAAVFHDARSMRRNGARRDGQSYDRWSCDRLRDRLATVRREKPFAIEYESVLAKICDFAETALNGVCVKGYRAPNSENEMRQIEQQFKLVGVFLDSSVDETSKQIKLLQNTISDIESMLGPANSIQNEVKFFALQ